MLNRFNTSFPFPFQRGEQERSVPDERWTLVEPRFESARIVFPSHFQVSSTPCLGSGPRAGSWTWGGEAAIKLAEFHVDRDKGSRRLCRSRLKKKKKKRKEKKKNERRHETTIYHLRFKADTKNCGNLNGNRGFRLFTRNPATYPAPRIFIECPTNDLGINGGYLETE